MDITANNERAAALLAAEMPSFYDGCVKLSLEIKETRTFYFQFFYESRKSGKAVPDEAKRYHNALLRHNERIEKHAEELAKADGKLKLKALPASASIEEYADAVFLSIYGVPFDRSRKSVIDYVREKDVNRLIDAIGKNGGNKASIKIFERMTGIRLGKTIKDRCDNIYAWAVAKEKI